MVPWGRMFKGNRGTRYGMTGHITTGPEYCGMTTGHGITDTGTCGSGNGGSDGGNAGRCGIATAMTKPLYGISRLDHSCW